MQLHADCIDHGRKGNRQGYAQVRNAVYSNKKLLLHRIVFFQHNGYWPPVVRHTCDNPRCINPNHLLGGTVYDNAQDRKERGEFKGPPGRFTAEQLAYIRDPAKRPSVLAKEFGVSDTYICEIRSGKRGKNPAIQRG